MLNQMFPTFPVQYQLEHNYKCPLYLQLIQVGLLIDNLQELGGDGEEMLWLNPTKNGSVNKTKILFKKLVNLSVYQQSLKFSVHNMLFYFRYVMGNVVYYVHV